MTLELELAEHVEHLAAEGLAGFLDLVQEGAVDVALAGLLGDQVPEVADLGLADAVDAAEALFQAVGVPGQVVVDHEVGALEVDALAGGVGGEQDLDGDVVEEALLGLAAVLATQATVDDGDGVAAAEQLVGDVVVEVVQGVAVLGEDDDLLVGCGFGRVNGARAVGGLRLPGAVRDAGGREDGFEDPGQFAPLGVAGAADFGSQSPAGAGGWRFRPEAR